MTDEHYAYAIAELEDLEPSSEPEPDSSSSSPHEVFPDPDLECPVCEDLVYGLETGTYLDDDNIECEVTMCGECWIKRKRY